MSDIYYKITRMEILNSLTALRHLYAKLEVIRNGFDLITDISKLKSINEQMVQIEVSYVRMSLMIGSETPLKLDEVPIIDGKEIINHMVEMLNHAKVNCKDYEYDEAGNIVNPQDLLEGFRSAIEFGLDKLLELGGDKVKLFYDGIHDEIARIGDCEE